jgi:hypothetical protein
MTTTPATPALLSRLIRETSTELPYSHGDLTRSSGCPAVLLHQIIRDKIRNIRHETG